MKIETGCRLHFGLIDLTSESNRVDGGIGLGLKSPGISLEAEESDVLEVRGPTQDRAERAASAVMEEFGLDPVKITIRQTIPQHRGLGWGTQLSLAAGFAVAEINNKNLSTRTMAEVVGRGGTSGIGTAVFTEGGFILDGGHSLDNKSGFLPSAASDVPPPPVLSRLEFPDWHVKVFIPDSVGAYGSDEVTVFDEECPIPVDEVQELTHIIIMKLMPSIVQNDYEMFKESINSIQFVGFKDRELDRQPDSLSLVKELQDMGYAAGMSSLGPAVFVISPNPIDVDYDSVKTIETKPSTTGAEFTK
jgi:beta-ribofuranosylaminobenzene 5'-phosphate synthase